MKRISIASPVFNGNEKKYLNECIDTGWVSANGRFVKEFEEKFAEYCGCKYAVSCSNGTVSLHLILLAMGIGSGDEVIMPTLTYIATANTVRYCGATPVFVDSEEDTFNIDPKKIEEKITSRTKAIMPVHLYGLPANMEAIMELSKKYNIPIIEDAAEAHGAEFKGERVGSFGLAASFSFFGNKVITSGEGGMVVTNDEELYKKMKLLKGQAVSLDKKYWHIAVGYNYRMTNMQAAVGLGQLENINWHIAERERIAKLYRKYLKGTEAYMKMQYAPNDYKQTYWMNNIMLQDIVAKGRDQVMEEMEACNIEMRPVFYPMHIMPPYLDNTISCPIAEKLGARGISLPSHAMLTEEEVAYICDCLKKIVMEG
ncbi:DegT/DnrJ/EryC1/StrS family aminotransferase [Anaerosporobacter sp.]|uniref:DegT/DnrJ/EryC1/StrS family aminotransferase n=1 Tax=Anaerosporobacter sp. TaxID=1872529 RepID=UPI00286EC8EA|nr:DegT/DnrJ/EryC1/StrS family aminotransferase [Anaerosporobacter sp.]